MSFSNRQIAKNFLFKKYVNAYLITFSADQDKKKINIKYSFSADPKKIGGAKNLERSRFFQIY